MLHKWFTIGIGVKRWVIALFGGMVLVSVGFAAGILRLNPAGIQETVLAFGWLEISLSILGGFVLSCLAVVKLSRNLLAPYRRFSPGHVIDVVYTHSKRQKGVKVVAIGGGTGLPSVLRGMKSFTTNITAVVTVADDGGSSGVLRRDLGVLPPGDIRNNIAALANDESLLTQLFQYRFENGALSGHAFGNLFIAALAGVSGSLETALPEVERVLNIQGRVLPATLEDVHLVAEVQKGVQSHPVHIHGESNISNYGGRISHIAIRPADVSAYQESVKAIHNADMIVIGPGSLYTSILPNLLVKEIAQALRDTGAYKVYVCNVATQPGETTDFTVADHVRVLEQYVGHGVFDAVIANDVHPIENAGVTRYVRVSSRHHDILRRYQVIYTDLVDVDRPWRHDPQKLVEAIREAYHNNQVISNYEVVDTMFTNV